MNVRTMRELNNTKTKEELATMSDPALGIYFDKKFGELMVSNAWEVDANGEIVRVDTRLYDEDKGYYYEAGGTITAPEGTLDPVEKEELGLE